MKVKNIGMPERPLFEKYTREVLEAEASALGGSIILSNHEEGKIRYKLALVGMFLTSGGPRLETLMKRYLWVLKARYEVDKDIERFSSKDFEKWGMKFSSDELNELRLILYASHRSFASHIGGWNAEEWFASVDDEVVNLKHVENWEDFVQTEILKQYDAKEPASEAQRIKYHNVVSSGPLFNNPLALHNLGGQEDSEAPNLDFVDDDRLRNILESDWHEATKLLEAKAWKSCIILCGSLLEGLLLWKLEATQRRQNDLSQEEASKTADYEDFSLSLLLRASKEQQLLENESVALTDWAREYRNLIHPGNQRRSGRNVRKEHATIAMNLVMLVAHSMRV